MALILISRGSFSGGQLISRCLSKMAGITCLTREDLLASVDRHGDLASKVAAAVPKAVQNYSEFSALRRPYKILMQQALLEYARQGPIAYFGYAGHLLLPDLPHILRVRIIASLAVRMKMMMEREKIGEAEARAKIREQDEERNRWTRFMYGRTLRDVEQFDVCLNVSRLTFSTACHTLWQLAQQSDFETTPDALTAIENHYLSINVLAALVTDPRTHELEIGATAQEGCISLEGPFLEEAETAVVREIALAVPGVKQVNYTEGYAPPAEFAEVVGGEL